MMNRAQRRAYARNSRRSATMPERDNSTSWVSTIVRSRETDAGLVATISIKLHEAFAALRSGRGTDDDFDRLACSVNAGLIRAEQIDPLLEQTILAGRDALLECDRIRGAHGRYGFCGPGLAAMTDMLEAYEAIVAASTPAQMQAAIDESIRRVYRGEVATS